MFFRAKDIQLSSYFKVNLSEGKRVCIWKNVLDSGLHTLFTANQTPFGQGKSWFKMELCENLLNSNVTWLKKLTLFLLLSGIQG